MMGKFRSIVPVVLATAALSLSLVVAGCDDQSASPVAPANPAQAPPATSATAAQTLPATPPSTSEVKRGPLTITGSLPKLKDGSTVKLFVFDPKGTLDKPDKTLATAKVEHGRFTLTGTAGQPLPGTVVLATGKSAPMIVEPGTFTVVNTGAGLVVKGGDYNNKIFGYRWMPSYVAAKKVANAAYAAYDKEVAGLNMTDKKTVTAARKTLRLATEPVRKFESDYQAKILEGNASPLLKLFALRNDADMKRYPVAKRVAMVEDYARELGADNPVIARMRESDAQTKQKVKRQRAVGVGKPYKDIVAVDVNGKKVKLSDVLAKNKLVLLDFWASWCGPCRAEFPFIRKVYKEFHPQGFEVYAVSLDEDHDDWLKALREERYKNTNKSPLPWINLDDRGFGSKSAKAYAVWRIPANYLISSDGTIVGVDMREWNIEKTVQAQLKKMKGGHGG